MSRFRACRRNGLKIVTRYEPFYSFAEKTIALRKMGRQQSYRQIVVTGRGGVLLFTHGPIVLKAYTMDQTKRS